MKTLLLAIFISMPSILWAQQTHAQEIAAFQEELNKGYTDPEHSPLSEADRKAFTGHTFFPVSEAYQVTAKFVKNKRPKPFQMKTTGNRTPIYEKYGEAIFELGGQTFRLAIYQSHQLREKDEYKDHLFLPFNDLTNGITTYKGGRYIDLSIPTGDTIVLDFNKAYAPYCAYSPNYSCPIPPKENQLAVKIEAGVMYVPKK